MLHRNNFDAYLKRHGHPCGPRPHDNQIYEGEDGAGQIEEQKSLLEISSALGGIHVPNLGQSTNSNRDSSEVSNRICQLICHR